MTKAKSRQDEDDLVEDDDDDELTSRLERDRLISKGKYFRLFFIAFYVNYPFYFHALLLIW